MIGGTIKGIIFDLDGTLLESMGYWVHAGERYLESLGITPHKNLYDAIKTMTMEEVVKYLIHEYHITKTPDEVVCGIYETIEHAYFHEIQPKPGAVALFKLLRAQNIPFCIATATDRPLVEAALKRLDMLDYFEFIITCSECGMSKRNPKIYLDCAKRFHAAPHELAVFEDVIYAGATAKAAGFYLVGVRDTYAEADWDALSEIADRFIDSLEELL